ncbi:MULTISPECIES: cell wall-binding repeat-containing protein [Clostridium]|uniref:N-acetylmuramoyl-L-alanine amidase LytC n=1 Tax=Clostridium ragsdalei P11 TaxID=1353534 RepID=A0A1A6AMF5_9CLOT|nr:MULTISPECIES: cell wall-binding repeat-containing protein [Clostridium]OBR91254.1 N-acetylmuramoyl-L-alanine amidase LytC precursor [Clostridium ragsdalei P11]QXE17560.1 cell wall-binding repeat 2 family protein [Clostridium sp. 001]
MKKIVSKVITPLFVLGIAVSGFGGSVSAETASSTSAANTDADAAVTEDRISGNNRIETSLKISGNGWENGADTVVIAQGYGYADALCAAPLAKKNNAPIILSSKDSLSGSTIDELKRLKAKNAFVIGGTGSLSDDVTAQLKNIGISNVERLGGADRYETSVKIAQKLGSVSSVVVTSGGGYADSLSIAPIAASKGMPILLTRSNSMPDVVENYIKGQSVSKTYVVGGTAVIKDDVKNSLPNAERIGGATRFDTNLDILQNFKSDLNFDNVYVAEGDGPNGNEFADALSGAALAAQKSAPLVLIYKTMNSNSANFIVSNMSQKTVVTALGGTMVVPDTVVSGVVKQYNNKNSNPNPNPNPNPIHQGGSSGGGNTTPTQQGDKLVSIDGKSNEGINLTITENTNKSITIQANSKNNTDYVTITLYDEDGNLKYIDQTTGSMNLNTILDAGKYKGVIKASNTDKINIPEFQVK